MIRVREFIHTNDGDYEMIKEWYKAWEKECPSKDLLPEVGFIVDEAVAGFLYSTDSKVCFIDCFISDPSITKAERDTALDVLVHSLMEQAKRLENRVVVANSISGSIADRAMKHGFGYAGEHGVFYKEVR